MGRTWTLVQECPRCKRDVSDATFDPSGAFDGSGLDVYHCLCGVSYDEWGRVAHDPRARVKKGNGV